MSHLIEDSLIDLQFSLTSHLSKNADSQGTQLRINQKDKREIKDKVVISSTPPILNVQKDVYRHKFNNFTLIVFKKCMPDRIYKFEGLILFNDHIFAIRYRQKRILFGKYLMKQKEQRRIKLSINFCTGEVHLKWPEIYLQSTDSVLSSKIAFQKLLNSVFQQYVHVFQNEFISVLKNIELGDNIFLKQSSTKFSKEKQSQDEDNEVDIQKAQKYLFMSTTIDSFSKQKQTFKRLQDQSFKEIENIMKVQSNIDLSFGNLSQQLALFTLNNIKRVTKSLVKFGFIDFQQKSIFESYLNVETSKGKYNNQYQFVLNNIGILKIEKRKRFLSSGGSCNVFITKMMFQYIFSDDPKFWIEENRKSLNNIVEKIFVIKQPKPGCQQKLRHQNQVVKQMKSGYSIYLPKYYRVENNSADVNLSRDDDILIIDYLKGENLDEYATNNKEYLSFWTKIFLVRNIVNGLRFIVNYKIVHLDLKPANIIVTNDLLAKIIDFSESYHPKVCKQSKPCVKSLDYLPGKSFPYACPQVAHQKPINYDEKCDIFSLGVIMFELFIGREIYEMPKQKIRKFYQNQSYLNKIFVSPEFFQSEQISPIFNIIFLLTMKCLDPRPSFRPTLNWISIIINHLLMYFKGR